MNHRFTEVTIKSIVSVTFVTLGLLATACSNSGQPRPETGQPAGASSSATSSTAQGGGEFEGIITMMMKTDNQKGMEMVYSLKGNHSRVETKIPGMPEGPGVMLMDMEAGKMTTLMPQRKMYMMMDLNQTAEELKEESKGANKSGDEAKFPKLTPTGKQETIAGHNCEHWLIGDKQDIDMCVAKGLGYFGMGGQMGGGAGMLKNLVFNPGLLVQAAAHPEWLKFLQGGAFPLKLSAMEDGKVRMSMEVTSIERQSLDDSLFAIPQGYKEFNMQNMMRGGR